MASKPPGTVGKPFVKNTKQRPGSKLEVEDYINGLKPKAAKFDIITFIKVFFFFFFFAILPLFQ